MTEWASLRAKAIALKGIPLSLFGYSLIRAWISLLYANPALPGGGPGMGPQLLFDLAFVGASVAMALGARRLTPLNDKPAALAVSAAAMGGAVLLQSVAAVFPASSALTIAAAALAGVGTCGSSCSAA